MSTQSRRATPRTSTYSAAVTWVHLCGLRLQSLDPDIDDDPALELALQLHSAWPGLGPEEAAEGFLRPLEVEVEAI